MFIINSLQGGGAEKVLIETVNNLPKEDWEITVQTITNIGIYQEALEGHIKYRSIINFKNKKINDLLSFIVTKVIPANILYRVFIKDDNQYEIAFLEGLPTKIIAASTNSNAKKIAWIHTDLLEYPDSYKVFGNEEKQKKAYTKFDAIGCVSDGVKESFLIKYGKIVPLISTVYNIVDDKKIIRLASERIDVEKKKTLLVSVGRLTVQKGFDSLLQIVKKLNDEKIEFELWIIGEGEERENLEDYINDNHLNNVKLLGFQDNPYKYIAKADIFVSSSKAEGFSTVITEANLLKVPIISTNTSGANEPTIWPRCSIVVDNEEELYQEIRNLLIQNDKLEELQSSTRGKTSYFEKEKLIQEFICFLLKV